MSHIKNVKHFVNHDAGGSPVTKVYEDCAFLSTGCVNMGQATLSLDEDYIRGLIQEEIAKAIKTEKTIDEEID